MKYKLYALASDFREFTKTIRRKNCLSQEQKDSLSGEYADKMVELHHVNIVLYGCNELEESV